MLVYSVFVSHQDFLRQIVPLTKRRALRNNGAAAFRAYRQAEAMVRSANLDLLAPILEPLYARDGRLARDLPGGSAVAVGSPTTLEDHPLEDARLQTRGSLATSFAEGHYSAESNTVNRSAAAADARRSSNVANPGPASSFSRSRSRG